jgi:2-dehydro-3-deoxyphosphogluconate aldolase/(4S)-4-hydroxy-2-oxoglutarate aldolase
LNPEILKKAIEMDFPFFPGVVTPSEIEQGLSLGVNVLKFFPSEASGGTAMIKAVSAPYAHLGVKFIPTGGVNIKNLEEYLALPQVLSVGGTWIAKKDAIAAGSWEEIKNNALEVTAVVRRVRG